MGCAEEDEYKLRCTLICPYQLREGSEIVVFVGLMIMVARIFSLVEDNRKLKYSRVMKKLSYLAVLVGMVLPMLVLSGCSREEHPLQNLVIISQQYREAEVRNGDIISLRYSCEFATSVEMVIKDIDNVDVLQHEKFDIKCGDGVLPITINVGRYSGRAIVYVNYENLQDKNLLTEVERSVTERFFVNILKVEDEPRPEDEIN